MSDSTLARICEAHGITIEDLRGPSHAAVYVQARRCAARELRARKLSLPSIGRLLHRHHTTILNLLAPKGAA